MSSAAAAATPVIMPPDAAFSYQLTNPKAVTAAA